MMQSIRQYIENDGKLLAECGGMMYLARSIKGMDGKTYPMVNVLPIQATMENMKLHLGYRSFVFGGQTYKGHEFHYSTVIEETEKLPSIAQQYNAKGEKVNTPLYRYKSTIAGYTHLYWGETDIFGLMQH